MNAIRYHSVWVWLLSFGFYLLTLAPTMGLGDVALLVESMFELRLSTHVNNHPLTVALGALFLKLPFSDFTFRVNLLSALCGSITVWVFYRLACEAIRSHLVALIGTAALLISHSMWWHSTIIENYAFNALATVCFLWSCVRLHERQQKRYVYLLFFIAALAVFNHIQMSFLGVAASGALVFYFFHMPGERVRLVAGSVVAFCIGFTPWMILFLYDWSSTGSFTETFHQALFGSFQHIMLKGDSVESLKETLFLIFFQTPSLFLLFVATGLFFFIARWRFSAGLIAILIELGLNTYFFAFYNTWDRFAFLLPTFIILIFLALFSLDSVFAVLRCSYPKIASALLLVVFLSMLSSPVLYSSISSLAESPESVWHGRFNNLYARNTHRASEYIANPNKRNFTDVDEFLQALFLNLPPDSIYIDTDARLFYPAKVYQTYYRLRDDILITMMNSWNIPNWGLSEQAFLRMLTGAFYTDAPLFLAATGHPFQPVLARSPFKFRKVFLSESAFIYRLITQKDQAEADIPRPVKAISLVAGVPANIAPRNMIFDSYVSFVSQNMSEFEGAWYQGDQTLIQANREGAFIEFLLHSNQSERTRLTIGGTTAPDFGRVRVKLGQQILIEDINLYSPSVVPHSIVSEEVYLEKGYHRLRIEFLTAPSQSEQQRIGLDYISID